MNALQLQYMPDELAEDVIVKKYSKQVMGIAKSLKVAKLNGDIQFSDLFQEGMIGLIKAYRDYDPTKGALSPYLLDRARGYMFHFTRDRVKAIKVYRTAKELSWKLHKDNNRDMTVKQIVDHYKVTFQEADEAKFNLTGPMSIDKPNERDEEVSLHETVGSAADLSIMYVNEFLNSLNDQQRLIVKLLEHEVPQWRIGEMIGQSQMYVSRHLKKIRQKYLEYERGEVI